MGICTALLLSSALMSDSSGAFADLQGTVLALRHDLYPSQCGEEGHGSVDYLYNNNPPQPSPWDTSTVYGPSYTEPPPAYYIMRDEYGETTWGQVQR